MAGRRTLVHPVLFSKHFKVDPVALKSAGLLDPILNSDTKLFIDPLLIYKSQNAVIMRDGRDAIKRAFENVIGLVDISEVEGDVAWKGAYKAPILTSDLRRASAMVRQAPAVALGHRN